MTNYSQAQIEEWAFNIWNNAEEQGIFPCDIERLVITTCPVDIVSVNGLKLSRIDEYFQYQTSFYQSNCPDKLLHGFLVASSGQGAIFVNGCDKQDERRFTIAHELAHFLVEHLFPRRELAALLGEDSLAVFDGSRPLTLQERLITLVSSSSINFSTALLENTDSSGTHTLRVWRAETVADKLALEMLAPYADVRNTLKENGIKTFTKVGIISASSIFREKYGLPAAVARSYAEAVFTRMYGGPSLFEEWGLLQ